MKLIDADILKHGINATRAKFRLDFETGAIKYKEYISRLYILDVFEEIIDVMPEYCMNDKEGDKE